MKKIIFSLLLLLPVAFSAQERSAESLLESAIKNIEADAAVQMAFTYSLYDDAGVEQFADEGSLKLSGDSYALLLSPMKLWCDGKTQWSYMAQNNEIYVADADSDDAQAYNPVHLMGLYKKGYNCSLSSAAGKETITMNADDGSQSFERVVLVLDSKSLRPLSMQIFMSGSGYVSVSVSSYKPGCNFDERVYRCPLEDFPTAEVVDMR